MTPEEQLDEARAKETLRRLVDSGKVYCHEDIAALGARLGRENWTPPDPVDPDILAFREWLATSPLTPRPSGDPNRYGDVLCETFLAGARMAREKERERAKVLLDYAWEDVGAPGGDEAKARSNRAFDIITKYEKGDQ